MIKNIFKTAIKFLWKNRVYNIINILGLTVAIASILIIILYITNEYRFSKSVTDGDKIYRIESTWALMPSFPGHILKSESGFVDNIVRVKIEDHDITYKNQAYRFENIGMADSTFFDIFNFRFILGSVDKALKTVHSIVLTQSESKRIFGNTDPMNEVILLENKYPFTVTGVIEDPVYFHLPLCCIATLESLKELAYNEILEQKDGYDYFTYIVGKPGHTKEQTEKKVNDKLMEYEYKYYTTFHLTSLNDLYFSPLLNYEGITLHGNKPVLYILFSIAVLLLILACINFINITIARSIIRGKEVGIKKIAGASKASLQLQFLFESVLIIFIALIFSLELIEILNPFFCRLIDKQVDFNLLYSPLNAIILFCVTLITGVLAGLYPALFLSSVKPISLFKYKTGTFSRNSVLSKTLVTFQYTISIVLIACTLAIIKQLNFLKDKELGFNKEHLLYIRTNDEIAKQQSSFKEELLKIPGIIKAAYSSNTMGHEWGNWVNDIDGEGKSFKVNCVDPNYFDVLGITINKGRKFTEFDHDAAYIINETAVKEYNIENPLELRMKREDKYFPVIGVVKDFHFQSPRYPVLPVLFYFKESKYRFINLKISTNNIEDVINRIEKTWNNICSENVLEYYFMDEKYDKQYKSDEQLGSLVGIGGAIAIIIACLGILGLAISSAELKIKEIGIRKINGAKITDVMIMLNQDFAKWVAIAFIIATPIAWFAMHKWIENFAYKTDLSWWIFAIAGLIALGIALLTVSWQSWRAATRNPVEALRYE